MTSAELQQQVTSPGIPDRQGLPDQEPPSRAHMAACARRLEVVVEDVWAFLERQLEQLTHERRECQSTLEKQAAIEETYDALKKQQAEWVRCRDEERSQIEEEMSQLLVAWERVEEEYRRIRVLGQNPQPTACNPDVREVPAWEKYQPSNRDLIDAVDGMAYEPAAVQFQQLRREIRQHAQRKR